MAQQQAQMQAQAPQPQTPAQPQDDIEPQIAQQMQQLGFSPQAIDQAISMSRQGANEQQIAQALGVTNG
jgi:Holliday junction resolvasome RuvABC DNA-binding subunit